jgi:hypothetical protein
MKSFFSRVNFPTLVAVMVGIVIDKKLGLTDKIVARI